jgi:hypothetical protein
MYPDDRAKPGRDEIAIDQPRAQKRSDEVSILLPQRAEFRGAEVFLVRAPPDELRIPRRRSSIHVLDLDQTTPPTSRQDSRMLHCR